MIKMEIKLKNVDKIFRNGKKETHAIKNVTLNIKDKEFFGVLGASGAGKTTLMRLIAGLEIPTKGEIYFDNTLMAKDGKNIQDVEERNIGMVFQTWGLYPHLSVYDNIAFPLRIKKYSEETIKKKIYEITDILNIRNTINMKPGQISGGQQQRVSLCRALVKEPSILILDEPFSNLDAVIKDSARELTREIKNKLDITTIIVSHDPADIFSLADRACVIDYGVVEQIDTPLSIYNTPKNINISKLIGDINIINGKIIDGNNIQLNGKNIPLNFKYDGNELKVGIRPEDIKINKDSTYDLYLGKATVKVSSYASGLFKLLILLDESEENILINSDEPLKVGSHIDLYSRLNKLKIFSNETGEAINNEVKSIEI
jgi:glucose/arabinose transport system ATP-binding protein